MTDFKDRLWRDLVREHGAELAHVTPSDGRRLRRPRLLAGTTVGLAGIGTTIALALSAAGTAPAFAVTHSHDGTWSVTVRDVSAIPSVNARLAALRMRARVVAVAEGCSVSLTPKLWAAGSPATIHGARFDPKQIPAGKTLVLAAFQAGRRFEVKPAHVVRGFAPACLPPVIVSCLTPARAFTPAPGHTTGNTGNSGVPGASGNAGSSGNGNSGKGNSGSVDSRAAATARRDATPLKPLAALTAKNHFVYPGGNRLTCSIGQVAAAPGGNTGNTGNSGTSGNSGTTGNSGATGGTGNSGTTGTTGNSGT